MSMVMPTQEMVWTADLFTYDDFVCARNYRSELGTTRKKITLTNFHTSIVMNISEDGIFSSEYVEIIRMMIMVGCLSLCKNHNISVEASNKQLERMRKSRGVSKAKHNLDEMMEFLKDSIDVNNSEEVANILDYYSNSKIVRDCYYSTYGKQANKFSKKNRIHPTLLSRCRDLLSKELDTSVFNIRVSKDNDTTEPYIPNDFMALIEDLRNYLFNNRPRGEVVRMCFIQGLYILSEIIVTNRVNFEEKLALSAVKKLKNLYLKVR